MLRDAKTMGCNGNNDTVKHICCKVDLGVGKRSRPDSSERVSIALLPASQRLDVGHRHLVGAGLWPAFALYSRCARAP